MAANVTLTAGMRKNLFSLQQTDKMLGNTQTRLASGRKVNSALDDPVKFFKARDHYNRASDLLYRKTEMGESIKTIEAANTGIEGMINLLEQMKSLASAAKTASSTTVAGELETQFNTIHSQIGDMADDSNYGGTNLLDAQTMTVVFNAAGDNQLDVSGFTAYESKAAATHEIAESVVAEASFYSGANISVTGATSSMDAVTSAISNLRSEAQQLASALSTISIREEFTDKMANTLNSGGDKLTLADMNEEGANMMMLQTRQALGTTSLSLSSQAAQSVLRLF